MELEKFVSQNNVGGLAHGKDHIGQQVTGLIIAYDHTDAGEHKKKRVSHIGCRASYTKRKKVV